MYDQMPLRNVLLFSEKFIYLAGSGVLRNLRDFVETADDQTIILQSRKRFKGNVNQGLEIDWNLQFLGICPDFAEQRR